MTNLHHHHTNQHQLSKIQELTILAKQLKADIILIQETKLNTKNKTPNITGYTSIRKDRTTEGGGLMTYIKDDITYTELFSNPNSAQTPIENQSFKRHLTKHKQLKMNNLYIPPRYTTNPHHQTENQNIEK